MEIGNVLGLVHDLIPAELRDNGHGHLHPFDRGTTCAARSRPRWPGTADVPPGTCGRRSATSRPAPATCSSTPTTGGSAAGTWPTCSGADRAGTPTSVYDVPPGMGAAVHRGR
ncbi:hypothetical protein HBB16_12260 [Pseudonocardia sp. MCCB 268]|nr:hypothetical protein [Pseudonocardia cytotoxica]